MSPIGQREPVPHRENSRAASVRAHPSLALVKYWGKQQHGTNIPATGSIGVSLAALVTETTVTPAECDTLSIDGVEQPSERYQPFFAALRDRLATVTNRPEIRDARFHVESTNSYPTAAGLASSAGGFAALTVASCAALGVPREQIGDATLSAIARVGSGSAARSVFGGFVRWDAGAEYAESLYPPDWWPELRVVVVPVSRETKSISSRDAMNRTRATSPMYAAWVADAPSLVSAAALAIGRRDLPSLGSAMRRSYLRMFATMFAADPPILYWTPESVEAIRRLEKLRSDGIEAWETMDAGPQIKVLTTADHAETVRTTLEDLAALPPIVSEIGGGVTLIDPTQIQNDTTRGEASR